MGVGCKSGVNKDKILTVITPLRTPAMQAGIRSGDLILCD